MNLTNITDTKSVSALSTSAPLFVGGKSDMKYRHDQYRKMIYIITKLQLG